MRKQKAKMSFEEYIASVLKKEGYDVKDNPTDEEVFEVFMTMVGDKGVETNEGIHLFYEYKKQWLEKGMG